MRGTWSSYFLNTDGVILVVDSTDRERAPLVREELGKLLTNEELKQACILVFANKQDLREAMTAAEISEHLQLHAIRTHEVLLASRIHSQPVLRVSISLPLVFRPSVPPSPSIHPSSSLFILVLCLNLSLHPCYCCRAAPSIAPPFRASISTATFSTKRFPKAEVSE